MITTKLPRPLKYRHEFKVKGRVSQEHLPEDMLRYDQCFPVKFVDNGEVVYVEMVAYTEGPRWEPTKSRWLSFGWEVIQ